MIVYITMQVAVVVGNPKPASRTLAIAACVARSACSRLGGHISIEIDLALHADEMFKWPSEAMSRLGDSVASCDLLVIASPTYKATYTGLLKAFLDRYPSEGLSGVTAVPVMTGASERHAMAVDTALRPLLVELGASVPTRGLYFVMSEMAAYEELVETWALENLREWRLHLPPAEAPHMTDKE